MGMLKDFLDTINDVREIAKNSSMSEYGISSRPKSISEKAKEGVLQFPVIAENNIDIAILSTTTKMLEKNYATFIQMVYSMNPVVTVSDKEGIGNYLNKLHQNMNVKGSVNNLYVATQESYGADIDISEFILESVIVDGSTGRVLVKNRESLYDVMESFRTDALNDKFKPQLRYDILSRGKATGLFEAEGDSSDKKGLDHFDGKQKICASTNTSTDYKKANDLVPTTMVLKLNFQDSTGKIIGTQDFIIGIKCVLHPVTSKEAIANLSNINRGKFFDFIRWTSGEIDFFKDFVLNLNEIKTDIANRSAGSNPLWLALKNRAELAKVKNRSGIAGQLLPNATIIVSMETIEYINRTYNLDFMDPSMLKRVMQKFFLLGFVIIDESQLITHVFLDGDSDFEVLSFEGMATEGKSKSGDLKDMLKLANRM